MSLTQEQQKAYADAKARKNVFITGSGGVGKSHLIKEIINTIEDMTVTASTGVAAVSIQGRTLNSTLYMGLAEGTKEEIWQGIKKKFYLVKKLKKIKRLIIDEISMIDAELFDKVEYILRQAKNPNKMFGGCQILISGDLCQIPPVQKIGETKKLVIESESYKNGNFTVHYLREIQRQKDKSLIENLQKVRLGEVDQDVIDFFAPRVGINPPAELAYTRLESHNRNVDKINEQKLSEIDSPIVTTKRTEWGDETPLKALRNGCPVPENLKLKIGCVVVCLANVFPEEGVVNGSVGRVKSFEGGLPVVRFNNGFETLISWREWETKEWRDGEQITIAGVRQVPLKLAWAMSIHKVQSQTLSHVSMNLSNCFERGQSYTALSRIKCLSGCYISSIDWDNVITDPVAVEFYKNLEKQK